MFESCYLVIELLLIWKTDWPLTSDHWLLTTNWPVLVFVDVRSRWWSIITSCTPTLNKERISTSVRLCSCDLSTSYSLVMSVAGGHWLAAGHWSVQMTNVTIVWTCGVCQMVVSSRCHVVIDWQLGTGQYRWPEWRLSGRVGFEMYRSNVRW